VNSGEVRNRGIELAATMTPIERPDFRWNVVANWSKNTNKVLSLYSGVQRIVVGSYWNVDVTADVGQPYGNLVGTKWRRDDRGREHDWNDRFVVPNAVYQNGTPDTTRVLAQDYWHNTFYAQEMGIVDATYLKLRELRLAYNLPPSVARFLGLSDATVALVGHN